jgi:hypothetical protein
MQANSRLYARSAPAEAGLRQGQLAVAVRKLCPNQEKPKWCVLVRTFVSLAITI